MSEAAPPAAPSDAGSASVEVRTLPGNPAGPASGATRGGRWRFAAFCGIGLSLVLLLAAGPGALTVILPAWLVGLALRYDNHTGSLTLAAVLVAIVMLVMLGLIALLAMAR